MKWFYFACATVFLMVISGLAALLAWTLAHPTIGAITGQVVDRNGPVARARVIVSFGNWHLNPILDTSPHDIGLEADENGKFSIRHHFDFPIGLIIVSACSPANELGWTEVREPRDSQNVVIINVGRRVDNPKRQEYQYNYFRAHSSIMFEGTAWPPPPNDPYYD